MTDQETDAGLTTMMYTKLEHNSEDNRREPCHILIGHTWFIGRAYFGNSSSSSSSSPSTPILKTLSSISAVWCDTVYALSPGKNPTYKHQKLLI